MNGGGSPKDRVALSMIDTVNCKMNGVTLSPNKSEYHLA